MAQLTLLLAIHNHQPDGNFGHVFQQAYDDCYRPLVDTLLEFPTVKVILGHMGHCNVVYINGAIDVAERNANVYLETSGMPMPTKIREAVERVGPDRVLFGSDIPFHHPKIEIDRVHLSGLSPELVERVLSTNARALFLGE